MFVALIVLFVIFACFKSVSLLFVCPRCSLLSNQIVMVCEHVRNVGMLSCVCVLFVFNSSVVSLCFASSSHFMNKPSSYAKLAFEPTRQFCCLWSLGVYCF